MFIVSPKGGWVSPLVPYFVVQYCVLSSFEIILVGCFTLFVFLVSCDFFVLWLFLTMPCVDLQCVFCGIFISCSLSFLTESSITFGHYNDNYI